jgi:hypothetical protein
MIKVLIMVLLVGVVLPVMAAHFDEWSSKLRAGKSFLIEPARGRLGVGYARLVGLIAHLDNLHDHRTNAAY